jgi:disulfide bond formation protein DsbB
MLEYVPIINKLLAIGMIVLQVASLILLVSIIFKRSASNTVLIFFKKYGVAFAFTVALGSLLLSLLYSEVIGYAACELCIVQRYFIYPQVLLLGMALWKPKKMLINLSALLAFVGMFVSMYHVYVENGGSSDLACSTYQVGAVTCAARYVFEFGYITVPVMALTAQIFILLIALNYRYFSKRESGGYTS